MSYKYLDTTLRDGEQRPGISFTKADKLELASGLAGWGVEIIEAGIPAMGRTERETLDELHSLGLGVEILVWNRLATEDLDLCLESGYPSLHFSVPVSDILITKKLGRDRAWVLDQVDRVVGRAAEAGCQVSLGAEDSSRADLPFVFAVFDRAARAGASRVRYADTLGLLTPAKTAYVVGSLVSDLTVPLDFHGHDDFGLAAANTLVARDAGAEVLSCSLLGLGERAGNAALEEVAGALRLLQDCPPVGGDLRVLIDLCQAAACRTGYRIDGHKALVGSEVFSHQSGIHVDGLLKDPRTYEAWPPETFGGTRKLRFGKHSGTRALRYLAGKQGVDLTVPESLAFLEHLRHQMGTKAGVDPEVALASFLDIKRRTP